MIKLGGLQILMALYQYLKHDEEVAEEISKLLSVASLNKDNIQDIFSTGMIKLLEHCYSRLLTLLFLYSFLLTEKDKLFEKF